MKVYLHYCPFSYTEAREECSLHRRTNTHSSTHSSLTPNLRSRDTKHGKYPGFSSSLGFYTERPIRHILEYGMRM